METVMSNEAVAVLNPASVMAISCSRLTQGKRAISVSAPSKVSGQLVGASLRDGYTAK
jgi:hypothetical protein